MSATKSGGGRKDRRPAFRCAQCGLPCYSNEGDEPAHIHVRSGDKEVKFWLHDVSVAVKAGFPAHEIGDIMRHLKQNREILLSAWNEHFGN